MDIWHQIVADFANLGSSSALAAFGQVLMIDIMLAGDNAIIVGALAAGLPPEQRRRVILIGILAALMLRIVFALAVTQLLQIVGLVFGGGLVLLWVGSKMLRELWADRESKEHVEVASARSFASAAWAVAVADVSMSLDNVLAVAGAAREHPGILVVGLLLSVALMGVAANVLARVIERYSWIAWFGAAVVFYVGTRMVYDGFVDPQTGVIRLIS